MPNWEHIRNEWETTKITLAALAEKHDIKIGTLKSRKSRENWSRDATKKDATKNEKVATIKKPRYPNGHPGNKNPENQFAERNQAARKHGLFSRYIPQATLEIMGMLDKSDPADLIWDQIQIQYAAIIRSQEIMFVESKDEMIKELKKSKYDVIPDPDKKDGFKQITTEEEYEFQFAWDRQAAFLNAQSRAIAELRASIKQFLDLAHDEDERRLKLELMQANITKAKAEADRITKENTDDDLEEIIIVDAWSDDDE